jgi:hypothetical protein
MRKQVERIQQQASLICDETRTYRVSCNITVYQNYVDTSGYGGRQYTPGTFEIVGTIVPENLPGPAPVGQETNVLDFGNGRKISINFRGQMLERFKSKPFSENDDMTFFDTPLYRRLEEE